MADYDPTDAVLLVDGQAVAEFVGLDDFQPNTATSPNETDGRIRYGVNRTAGANGIDFSIRVRQTSTHLGVLYGLALQQKGVPIVWKISKNLDKYPAGYIAMLGCVKGYLQPPSFSHGQSEAGDVVFQVTGIDPIIRAKAAGLGDASDAMTPVPGSYQGAI